MAELSDDTHPKGSSAKKQSGPKKNYISAVPGLLKTLGRAHSDWLFGAVAEFVDNARDAKATKLDISIDMIHPTIAGHEIPMLAVLDDGHGMGHDDILRMVAFGREQTDANDPNCMGKHGVGFKNAAMKLGRDALVLTQTANSRSIAFLSQSLNEGQKNIEIPIVTYNRIGQYMEIDSNIQDEASATSNLDTIREFSPFNQYFIGEKAGLFTKNGTGTQIYVWNLEKEESEYCLEWDNGMEEGGSCYYGDIFIRSLRARSQTCHMTREVLQNYSLRSYLEVIFYEPQMTIKVQDSLVNCYSLERVLSNPSIESGDVLGKKVQLVLGHSQPDFEQGNCGIFLYWHGRLIEAYKKAGSINRNNKKSHGIIGVIDVTDVMDSDGRVLVHTSKQGFVKDCTPYLELKEWLGKTANEYLDKLVHKGNGGGSQHRPDSELVQCNNCRKWRLLDPGFDSTILPQQWFCYMAPVNGMCEIPEDTSRPQPLGVSSEQTGSRPLGVSSEQTGSSCRAKSPIEKTKQRCKRKPKDAVVYGVEVPRRGQTRKCKKDQETFNYK